MNPIVTTNKKNIATTKPMKPIALAIILLSTATSHVAGASATSVASSLEKPSQFTFQLNLDDGVTVTSYEVGGMDVETSFGKDLFLGTKTSLSILADGNVAITTDDKDLETPISLLVKTSDGKNQEITIGTFIGKPESLGIQADQTYYTKGFDTAGGYNNEGQVTGQNLLGTEFPVGTLHVMLTMPAAWAGYEQPIDQAVADEAAKDIAKIKTGQAAAVTA